MRFATSQQLAWLAIAITSGFLGCAGKNPEIPPASADNLQAIYQTYHRAAEALGRGPKDKEEFQKFLPIGTNPDEILLSPHDGKPYTLIWNVNPCVPPTGDYPPVLAHEQAGGDGQYDVITSMGVIRCNREELNQYLKATPGASLDERLPQTR